MQSRSTIRSLAVLICLAAAEQLSPLSVSAQTVSVSGQTSASRLGVVEGVVTSQGGTIQLGGVQIVVHDSRNLEVASILSEGDGRFHVTALHEGKYTLTASLDGFATAKAAVT